MGLKEGLGNDVGYIHKMLIRLIFNANRGAMIKFMAKRKFFLTNAFACPLFLGAGVNSSMSFLLNIPTSYTRLHRRLTHL